MAFHNEVLVVFFWKKLENLISNKVSSNYTLNVIPNIKNVSSIFKFIYSKSTEDLLLHYLTLLKPYNFMSMEDVYIMPLTPDILIYDENTFTKLFRISMQDTVDFCIRKSLRYCCREHIHIFGKLKNEYLESSILKE